MNYDLVIIGGGISGLYSALKLQKNYNKILLVEKNSNLGGRIQTEKLNYNGIKVNNGAARFSKTHKLLWKLLEDLNLIGDIQSTSNKVSYYYQDNFINNIKAIDTWNLILKALNLFYNEGYKREDLIHFTMKELTDRYLSRKEANWCEVSYPYSYKYKKCNAAISVNVIKEHYHDNFYTLKGGLHRIVEMIKSQFSNVDVMLDTECYSITDNILNYLVKVKNDKDINIKCKELIVALPPNALDNIKFTDIDTSFKTIIDQSIISCSKYRVYAIYPKKNGKVWFDGKNKLITDKFFKYIIPINPKTGLIMIAYLEGPDADLLYEKVVNGEMIKTVISENIKNIYKNTKIPEPIEITGKYWENGVHFYKKNVNPTKLFNHLTRPSYRPLWLVNEAYSTKQQWIEGSLLSATKCISQIEKRSTLQVSTFTNKNNNQSNDLQDTSRELEFLPLKKTDTYYTKEQVAKHNTQDDAWIILYGHVYDVTKWIPNHPGGTNAIMKAVGTGEDWKSRFRKVGSHRMNRSKILTLLDKYLIGKIR